MLLSNREQVNRVKLMSGISAFRNIVKDCSKIRNLPKIFLRSFQNAGPDDWYQFLVRVSPALDNTSVTC